MQTIIIDGHNLIPKIRGLNLKMEDDENQLIDHLQQYARLKRKKVDVYFDAAPIDQAGKRKYGMITAYFIVLGKTADDAIIQRIRKMGNKAKNVIVITSDRRVEREVRSCHATVVHSEQFAKEIEQALTENPGGGKPEIDKLNEKEVADWLRLFTDGDK